MRFLIHIKRFLVGLGGLGLGAFIFLLFFVGLDWIVRHFPVVMQAVSALICASILGLVIYAVGYGILTRE